MALARQACTAKHSDEVSTFMYCDFGDYCSCSGNALYIPPLGVLKCGRGGTHGSVVRFPCEVRAVVREQDMGWIQAHSIFGYSCIFVPCLSMYVELYS